MDENNFYENLKETALYGKVKEPISIFNNVIRLFISSTFKDMINERHEIMNNIGPKLEKYFEKKNYIFQIIDLQWGFFENATYDELSEDIWLEELKAAKNVSKGPFLVIILSHRYGSHVVPRKIDKAEFESILQCCDDEDKDLLIKSYSLDENNMPELQLLNNGLIQSNISRDDILRILNEKIPQINLSESGLYKYTKSVTELEIIEGIFDESDINRWLAFVRTVDSFETKPKLQSVLGDSSQDIERQFGKTLDYSNSCLDILKSKLKKKLGSNFEEMKVDIPDTEDFQNTNPYKAYLVEFKKKFRSKLKNVIDLFIKKNEKLSNSSDILKELLHHIEFCRNKVIGVVGRSEYVDTILSVIKQTKNRHIVIHGPSGCGKTSIVALIAQRLSDIHKDEKIVLLLRFIGTSRKSYDLYNLLLSLIEQLCELFKESFNRDEIRNLDKLQSYFKKFICRIAKQNPSFKFFLILDSLDQLNYEYKDVALYWLPDQVPQNLTIILSTITSTEYQYHELLTKRILDKKAFFEIGDLKQEEIGSMFDERLKLENRKLQENQRNEIIKVAQTNTLPLYLKRLVDRVSKWKSYTDISKVDIPGTLDSSINAVFMESENLFGDKIVRETLKYVTLSRYGIYETYLQKLLSKNEDVVNFVDSNYPSKISGKNFFPQIFLIRILRGLEQYLLGPMFRWYHRKFKELAIQRYCSNEEDNVNCHRHIVSTFLNERHNANKFWLQELPYHAIMSKDLDLLKDCFLLDLKFLQTKIENISIDDVIDDFDLARKHYPNDEAIGLLYQTLTLCSFKLRENPSELPGQLLGRLYDAHPCLNKLIEQCFQNDKPFLLPDRKFMAGPTASLKNTKVIHKSEIMHLLISNNKKFLISTSYEPYIRIYDTESMEEFKKFERKCFSTFYLTISNDDSIIYAYNRGNVEENRKEDVLIEAFNIQTEENIFNFETSAIPNSLLTEFREILFGQVNELWYVSKHNWYIINWLTGEITETVTNFDNKISPEDWPLSVAKNSDCLVVGMVHHSNVVSVTRSGQFVFRDFKDEKNPGTMFYISQNGYLILSLRRSFKSTFLNDSEYNLTICNCLTLETLRKIKVNKSFIIWHASPNADIIYGNAHNYINVVDITQRKVLFTFQHSAQMTSSCLLNDNTIICSTRDNKLHTWDISTDNGQSTFDDTFDIYCSRQIRFIRDEFDDNSTILFCYNIFDDCRELYLLFDYKSETIVKETQSVNDIRNDLEPLCLFNGHLFQFRHSISSYQFTNINSESILFERKTSNYRVFKRIDKYFAVFGIKSSPDEDSLCLCNMETLNLDVICRIDRISTLSISRNSIAYISENDNQNVHLITFQTTNFEKEEKTISNKYFDLKSELHLSHNGTFIAYCTKVCNKIFDLNDIKNEKVFFEIDGTEKFEFISDTIVSYRIRKPNLCVYLKDLVNGKEICVVNDDDYYRLGTYNFIKAENSPYLWFQRYSTNRIGKTKSSIAVYNINNLENCIAEIDTDTKLRVDQMTLLDDGNSILVKEFNALKFVKFSLKVNTTQ